MGAVAVLVFAAWTAEKAFTNSWLCVWPSLLRHVFRLEAFLFLLVVLVSPRLGCPGLSSRLQIGLLQHPEP